MVITPTLLPEVLVVEPRVFGDERGFFFESFNARDFRKHSGVDATFVQDNHSRSTHGVLRGLHYQLQHPQGKLVRVVAGEVFDVAVDIRRSSSRFGRWVGMTLSAHNKKQLWVPPGFAHGFLVVSEFAEFLYKTTDYWYPEDERAIRWDDPDLAIDWPSVGNPPTVSKKDATAEPLALGVVFS